MQRNLRSLVLCEGAMVGRVRHHRKFDVDHSFDYPVWMSLSKLGVSKLPRLLRPRPSKYMSAMQVLELVGETAVESQVWLLTQPSLLGRSFNPVSFYFVLCHGQLQVVVAHITNTPWDEDHCYVLHQAGSDTWIFDKTFHVSPFMPMGLEYRWRFLVLENKISIHMQLYKEAQPIFIATLKLTAAPYSKRLPWYLRLRFPCQNLMTLARIYWHAMALKAKGAQFYAHPNA